MIVNKMTINEHLLSYPAIISRLNELKSVRLRGFPDWFESATAHCIGPISTLAVRLGGVFQ
jgi:hypothetical protein